MGKRGDLKDLWNLLASRKDIWGNSLLVPLTRAYIGKSLRGQRDVSTNLGDQGISSRGGNLIDPVVAA
jgi:hypothetical protein